MHAFATQNVGPVGLAAVAVNVRTSHHKGATGTLLLAGSKVER